MRKLPVIRRSVADISTLPHATPMKKDRIALLRQWARDIKRDVVALWLAARDPRVPWYAKALAVTVAGYALSPIDLIPDFIPILGYLDDLLIVPLGILAAIKLIPDHVMADLRAWASEQNKPVSMGGLIAVLAIWCAGLALTVRWIWPHL